MLRNPPALTIARTFMKIQFFSRLQGETFLFCLIKGVRWSWQLITRRIFSLFQHFDTKYPLCLIFRAISLSAELFVGADPLI